MKATRLLLILPIVFLASCSAEDDPKRPVSNSGATITSGSITSGTPFYRALSLEEVIDIFDKVSENTSKINTVNSTISVTEYEVVDTSVTSTNYQLEANIRRFENTIIYQSFKADNAETYKMFDLYSEEYGSQIESYRYIDDNFENINFVDVFVKSGEANRTNILNTEPYSITKIDEYFDLSYFAMLSNPASEADYITYAAELIDGNYLVRFVNELVSSSLKRTVTYSYLIQDEYLLESDNEVLITEEVGEDVVPIQSSSLKETFSYTSNGDFERSSLPVVTSSL